MVGEEGVDAIVTGLLRRGGRGLLVHRAPTRRWYPDCWDLPGGHIEEGETPDIALRRELFEELGVAATVAGPADANFRGTTFRITGWVIDEWEGEPSNREPAEHDAIAWMTFRETATLNLAHPGLATLLRDALS
jgi:8-oxo-dGTP pyrophosphatase MutT (NUDIX family)